jgi:benzoate/toluate 1,2-dioxygenase beta subunit
MALELAELQEFIEHEANLLDEQRFDEWFDLFADDGYYWVPARAGQESPLTHVSLFYDDKPTLKIRVERLKHPQIHSQTPRSKTVRLVSNFKFAPSADDPADQRCVTSKFVMLEDRPGVERRLFGGRYTHRLRATPSGLRIVAKRVDLTNCDQFFGSLTQPF